MVQKPKNASILAQKTWNAFPAKLKRELKQNLPNHDGDRVPTGFDCRPLNKRKQESFLPEDAKYIKGKTTVTPTSNVIGRGTNGIIMPVRGNKNLIVKVERSAAWSPVDEEGEFFVKNKLFKEPLFIPTKAVNIGKSGKTGLLRPAVAPIVEPGYKIRSENEKALTNQKLKELRAKIIDLSYKGYVFADGLQLGVDKAGRILQFDIGAVKRYKPQIGKINNDPFEENDEEWGKLLWKLDKKRSTFGEIKRTPALDKKYLETQTVQKGMYYNSTSSRSSSSKSKSSSNSKHTAGSRSTSNNSIKSKSNSTNTPKQKIFIDPKFHFHPKHKEIYTKVKDALKNFPELKEICISAFYPTNKLDKGTIATAESRSGFNIVTFNVHTMPTNNSIYHELQHFVQYGRKSTKNKPHSLLEVEATLFGMGRMKSDQVENNFMTYFNTVPKSKVVKYGKMALKEKEKGNKHHVSTVFQQTVKDKEEEIKANKSNAKRWEPIHQKDFSVSAKFNVKKGSKNYAKGYTPSIINKDLKTNIRKSQQFRSNLFKSVKGEGGYAYEKDDLMTVPDWMKSTYKPKSKSTSSKHTSAKSSARSRSSSAKSKSSKSYKSSVKSHSK